MFLFFRILVSCFTAACMVFFFSLLAGKDLIHNQKNIAQIKALENAIHKEIDGNLEARLNKLGQVPDQNPDRRNFCIELAQEIRELQKFVEKQQILFSAYDNSAFSIRFKQTMEFAESSNVAELMGEFNLIKNELKNSSDSLGKRAKNLARQNILYSVLFFVMWGGLYLYFSRGIIFNKRVSFEA